MSIWANAVRDEVGDRLTGLGAHYGACRTARDGTRSVSWWFPPGARRRERRLVFRALGGGLDEWEVELAELTLDDDGRTTLVHGSRLLRTDRAGLAGAVADLVATGPGRRRSVRVDEDDGGSGRAVPAAVDGPAPGPRAAQAAASARRPPPPPRGVRVADGLLGVVVAVALLVACRADIDLAPSIASFAVPLLGVSAVWTVIGLAGAERRPPTR
jgi:hypothetical protein